MLLLFALSLALAAPARNVSDQAIVDYFRQVGVYLPDPITPLAVQALVNRKQYFYVYLKNGANLQVYPEGAGRMWHPDYPEADKEDEATRQLDTPAPLPIPPWLTEEEPALV